MSVAPFALANISANKHMPDFIAGVTRMENTQLPLPATLDPTDADLDTTDGKICRVYSGFLKCIIHAAMIIEMVI